MTFVVITSCTWILTRLQCWLVLHFFYTINKHYVRLLLLIPSKWETFVRKFNLNREVWFKFKKSDLNQKNRIFSFLLKKSWFISTLLGVSYKHSLVVMSVMWVKMTVTWRVTWRVLQTLLGCYVCDVSEDDSYMESDLACLTNTAWLLCLWCCLLYTSDAADE